VVLLSKRDLLPADEPLPTLEAPDAVGILPISSAAGTGIEEVKEYLWKFVSDLKAQGEPEAESDDAEEEEAEFDLEYDEVDDDDGDQ